MPLSADSCTALLARTSPSSTPTEAQDSRGTHSMCTATRLGAALGVFASQAGLAQPSAQPGSSSARPPLGEAGSPGPRPGPAAPTYQGEGTASEAWNRAHLRSDRFWALGSLALCLRTWSRVSAQQASRWAGNRGACRPAGPSSRQPRGGGGEGADGCRPPTQPRLAAVCYLGDFPALAV